MEDPLHFSQDRHTCSHSTPSKNSANIQTYSMVLGAWWLGRCRRNCYAGFICHKRCWAHGGLEDVEEIVMPALYVTSDRLEALLSCECEKVVSDILGEIKFVVDIESACKMAHLQLWCKCQL